MQVANLEWKEQAEPPWRFNGKLETGNSRLSACGFTLLELMTAIVVIGVLAAVLLDRLAYYQEMAERVAMESMVRTIKTGLQIRLAELIIANRQAEAAALEAEDPIRWLDSRPANYGGAYGASVERGKWYFDAPGRQLVYIVNNGDRLDLDATGGLKQIRFRARLQKDRTQFGGATVDTVTGITLAPVSPYRWR